MSGRTHQRSIHAIVVAAFTCLWAGAARGGASQTTSIIPLPAACEYHDGSFVIKPDTHVVVEGDAASVPGVFTGMFVRSGGFRLNRADHSPTENVIRLHVDPLLHDRLGDEGYELDVTTRAISIRAAAAAGLFYGAQTLRQLLPPAVFSRQKAEGVEWAVPCMHITDIPRFRWRGLLIDPARHFIPVRDIERFIDMMALHKFNHLQIHFTDDQGWRIEIKKYPRLTEVSAKMDFTTILRPPETWRTGPQAGGFYTQDEIRELIRYAAEHYVTIVPEIEMPAHTGAAIVSCPQIGLYPEKLGALAVDQRWNANERVLAPRPQTVAFMQDVLAEVLELFPSRYIHIGGDEANIGHWKQSPEMQTLIRDLGLTDVEELHSWFIRQMDAFLTSRGRQLVGWDEILQGGLAPGAVVMSWRGEEGGITAARAGHDVIMAPTSHTYFDYYQGPPEGEPKAIGGDVPLEKVYAYEPIPAALTADQAKHVLGGQGQLWGEFIATESHRQYMTYPRAAALAEALWSRPQDRNYDGFLARLAEHLKRLKALNVNYRRPEELKQVAPAARDYHFDGTISREVLENYLDRSVTMAYFLVAGRPEGNREYLYRDDDVRLIRNIGAKFIGRSIYRWNGESLLNDPNFWANARALIEKVHAFDPDVIFQACLFETISREVNGVKIPAWVFADFGLPAEDRTFSYDAMLNKDGKLVNHWGRASVPDVTRLETQLWFYYLAGSYIDLGCEALHVGQVALIGMADSGLKEWSRLLARIRAYAKTHARRHLVLIDAHVPTWGMIVDGVSLLDFNSFPMRIKEVPEKPCESILEVNYLDAMYKKSKGCISPSGWRCESLPYLVEFDNFGRSRTPGVATIDSHFIWGWDEISWFSLQPEDYRNRWLVYAHKWVKETDPNGHLQMPVSRMITCPNETLGSYRANTRSPACPIGYSQEETMKGIWSR